MQGFLLLDKPSGISSFGAVAKIRRLTNERRIGHTGTLDPMATGVLPIFLGKATSLSSYLSESDKEYIATVKLGIETDTDDITGNILKEISVNVTDLDISSALERFKGKIKQTPPAFSAIKQDGVRLYNLARQGKTVQIPEREIEVYDITLLSPINADFEFSFRARVSKGTYIRALARDIGQYLGCGATLSALRRTQVSGFDIRDAVSLDLLTAENIENYIIKEDFALPHIESIKITKNQAVRFSNGGGLFLNRLGNAVLNDGQIVKVYLEDLFIGLGIADKKNGMLNIKCNINKP